MPADSANRDTTHAELGIVAALKLEVGPLLDQLEHPKKYSGGDFTFRGGWFQGRRLAVVECGTGERRAFRATRALVEAHQPQWILSVGFSGALHPEMKVGDIVVGNSICRANSDERVEIDVKMPADEAHGLYVGGLVTVDHLVLEATEKQQLHTDTGALAVDMESLGVARACIETHTRFLVVRVISDDAKSDLPREVLSILGGKGTIRAGALAGSLMKRPSSVKDLWKLRERAVHAAERVAKFLEGVLPQLPLQDRPDAAQ